MQPQAGLGRHGGIGFELVLSFAVPQGVLEAETALPAFLKRVKEKEEAKATTRKVTVQEIPDVQGRAPSHAAPLQVTPQGRNSKRIAGHEPQAIPQERISEQIGGGKVPRVIPPRRISERIQKPIVDGPVQGTPQTRTSERIQEQTVDVPGQGIPQKRISERIQEQIVEVPGLQSIPQKRISKRIEEQIVDDSGLHDIPQERISERIEGRIGGNPSTSSTAAAPLKSAEWLGDRGFRTFSPDKKSATSTRQSSANMLSHSSSWTPAAYQRGIEVDEWEDAYLTRHLGPDWQDRLRRGEFRRGEDRW